MTTTLEILRRARERIAHPAKWIQGRVSDNVEVMGRYEPSRSEVLEGTRWSIVGAVCCESEDPFAWDDALTAFGMATGSNPIQIATFNDNHSHAEVLEVLDAAIRREEKL